MGRQFIKENKEEAIRILARDTHMKLEDFKYKDAFVLPTFDMPTTIYKYGLDKMYTIFKQYDLIEGDVDIDDMIYDKYSIVIDKDY